MKLFYENNAERFLYHINENFSFPVHLHSGLEFFLMQKGEIRVTIGNENRILKAGELSIAFPNQIHGYETEKEMPDNLGWLILCPAKMGGDFLPALLASHPSYPFLTKDRVHPDILYAFRSLQQIGPDAFGQIAVIQAYIQLMLARLLPNMELIKNRDSNPPGLTAQLVTYLSEHYTEPVSLKILSKQLGASRYSISRIFSEKLHTSFSSYMNSLRIDNAKLLLQGSDYDILTISLMCGYENPRTFNRAFQALCSCPPREYRKKQRSGGLDRLSYSDIQREEDRQPVAGTKIAKERPVF